MTPLFVTWQLTTTTGTIAAAASVKKALQSGAVRQRLYDLHSWVIMRNEVRMLVSPKAGISHIMQSITRSTHPATTPIYEYRWIRDSRERARLVRTMERVPVQAGLVSRPEEWPWSSAHTE